MNDSATAEDRERGAEARITSIHPEASGTVRRAKPRHRVDLDVSIGSDHNFYAGFIENMSVGGVFVATHMLKAVGEQLELTIYLPDSDRTVCGVGEVRWTRDYSERSNVPPGMGIRFVELEEGAENAIEHFLGQREPLFFEDG